MDEGYKKAQHRIQQAIEEKHVKLSLEDLKLTAVPPKSGN